MRGLGKACARRGLVWAMGWLALATLTLLSGCATSSALFGSSSADPGARCACQSGTSSSTDGEKPPPPRTLPDAICAYLHCLQCPPAPDAAKKDDKSNGDNKKSDTGNGDKKENGKAGKTGGEQTKGNEKADAPKDDSRAPADQQKSGKAGKTGGEQTKANETADLAKGDPNGSADKADDQAKDAKKDPDPSWLSAHAQATMITQAHDQFRSPYAGTNSLPSDEPSATSVTATLFLMARLWEQCGTTTDLIFNPELAGGRGFGGVVGVAGFPNGEITRVGLVEPTPYIARLFVRQTFGLGGEQETVKDEANEIAGKRDIDRITISLGKVTPTDIVDDNAYSHDPRVQFLNWSLMYNGAYDYPSNVRGYNYGFAIDFNSKYWAFRYGIFAEPEVANGAALDPDVLNANGQVWELERRYTIEDHPGSLRLLAYLNHAHMGNYREALALEPVDPEVTATRAYRYKYGFGLNWEQEITKDLGLFSRLGWNDGQSESWAFTEIDQTASLGLLLKGTSWCRPEDSIGFAGVINGLSDAHRDYLAAGGLGFIIGDGKLNYAPEEILEAFYSYQLFKGINVTLDVQGIENPAYNQDRGPVMVYSLRVHLEF